MAFMVFGKVVPKWTCLDWNRNETEYNQTEYNQAEYNQTESEYSCSLMEKNIMCKQYNWTTDFYSTVPQVVQIGKIFLNVFFFCYCSLS